MLYHDCGHLSNELGFEEAVQGIAQRGVGIRRVQKDHIIQFVEYRKGSIDTATVDRRLRREARFLQIVPDYSTRLCIAFNKIHPASTATEGLDSQRTGAGVEVDRLPVLANQRLQDGERCPPYQFSRGANMVFWRSESCSLCTTSNNTHDQSIIITELASQSKRIEGHPRPICSRVMD